MKIKANPDIEKFRQVSEAVRLNGGYCPCMVHKNDDTKCICKDFADKVQAGYKGLCHCGRYISE